MSTPKEDLTARLKVVTAELAAMNSSAAGGMPNLAQQDGGTSIDHDKYKRGLYDELKQLTAAIIAIDALEDALADTDGPIEEYTRGYT